MGVKQNQLEDYFDVIIVGFGPVGQLCSTLLNKYGLNTAAIESNLDIYSEPRAISIDDEIQRIISNLGLWDDFTRNQEVPDFADLVFPNGKVILRGPVTSTINGFPFVSTIYQPALENLLRQNLNHSKTNRIFLGYETINFKQENDFVDISIKHLENNKLSKLKSKYLFACDGSESFIRNKLKINLIDYKYNKEWLIVDIKLDESNDLEKVTRFICDPERPTIFTTLKGDRVRIEFQLLAGEDGNSFKNKNKHDELINSVLGDRKYLLERLYLYRYKGNCASELRKKNVFLIGDSAHQIPPFAGQGLSSGLRDASNLCWKIAYVIKNQINDEILDTYQIERMEEIQNSIHSSIALGKLIDSLSVAFKKNTPLEEAIPPEAREQAYGKKSLTEHLLSKGLFSRLVKDSNIGKPIPMVLFSDGTKNIYIDDLLDLRFAVISKCDPKELLSENSMKLFKTINAVFLDMSKYSFNNSKLEELIDIGDILIRPDKIIYGITSNKVSLQDLTDELFSQLKY